MKNLITHNTALTAVGRDSAIAQIPARVDSMMAADPWMKFFLTYDPTATARRVKTPVLILTGANDQQAPPEQVPEQEAAFRAAGNRDVTAHAEGRFSRWSCRERRVEGASEAVRLDQRLATRARRRVGAAS